MLRGWLSVLRPTSEEWPSRKQQAPSSCIGRKSSWCLREMVDRIRKERKVKKRKSHSMEMQRPAISHEGYGRYTDRNESAAETSFLNREGEEVVTANFVNREIVRFGSDMVVPVKNPACSASLDARGIRLGEVHLGGGERRRKRARGSIRTRKRRVIYQRHMWWLYCQNRTAGRSAPPPVVRDRKCQYRG